MPAVYSKEKAKYGNLTGQIIIWPMEINNDLNAASNKAMLPSGYLRCDGTVYNASDFPALAEICGRGLTGKFVRRDTEGDPLQFLTDEQFVVPDLGSKYPRPTPGADAGVYRGVRVITQNGDEISKSGVGVEASATLGTEILLTYSGSFLVPSQEILMKGKPGWSVATDNSKVTDNNEVDAQGIHGHMHFGTWRRSRLKSIGTEVEPSDPEGYLSPFPIGLVAYWNASTVPIQAWMDNTQASGCNYPGSNQPPCVAMASNKLARGYQYLIGAFSGTFDPTAYSGACYNDGDTLEETWKYYCLLNEDWNNFPVSEGDCRLNGAIQPSVQSGTNPVGGLLGDGVCIPDANDNITSSEDVTGYYKEGTSGVPLDWKNSYLHDVLPLNSNFNVTSNTINASLFNELTETAALNKGSTSHFHKIEFEAGTHNFTLVTDALELSPENLETTLRLSVDDAASLDQISMPFIVMEYLIKI